MNEMLSIAAPRMSADQIQGKKKVNAAITKTIKTGASQPPTHLPFSDTFEPTSPPSHPRKKEKRSQDVIKTRGISPLKRESESIVTHLYPHTHKSNLVESTKTPQHPCITTSLCHHHPSGAGRHQKLPKNTSLPPGNTMASPSSLTYSSSLTIPPLPPLPPTPSICK